jgi:hypothetical protein
MALELSRILGGAVGRITSGGPARAASNPIMAALIITALSFLVFFTLLRDLVELRECSWRLRVRLGFYMFISTSLILALSYYGTSRKLKSSHDQYAREGVIHQVTNARALPTQVGSHIPVTTHSIFGTVPVSHHMVGAPVPPQPSVAATVPRPAATFPQAAAAFPQAAPASPQQAAAFPQQAPAFSQQAPAFSQPAIAPQPVAPFPQPPMAQLPAGITGRGEAPAISMSPVQLPLM